MADVKKVKPAQPGGFNDYHPPLMLARSRMIDAIRRTYELFGFVPLETPCVEFAEVLLGEGGETDKEVFFLNGPEEDKELALRFDLTVPLARYVAANTDLLMPFKRYQVGNVFRGEKPQAGRFRQFAQVDADIIGAKTGLPDAEIIAVTIAALEALGVEKFVVRINDRKIHDGLAAAIGIQARGAWTRDDLVKELLRVLDKVDKIGRAGVREELRRRPQGEHDRALQLGVPSLALIDRFLDIAGDNAQKLDAVGELVRGDSGAEGVAELRTVFAHLRDYGIDEGRARMDLSVARGLDYYTGPVLETTLLDLPEIGSVASGGRYDEMIGRFHANPIPAVGTSIGLDRLFDALQKLELVKTADSEVEALLMVFDPALVPHYLRLLRRLRHAGIAAEIYLGSDSGFKAQMRYGLRKGVRHLVICGEDEMNKNGVQVKDLIQREQVFVADDDLLAHLLAKRG
ncbi:MAG TPA: histidine--tRNA ligase [bacterium]|nr:histidine--tRNA ligase [bacterium]